MYELFTAYLENGLKIVMHRIPNSRTIGCGVWINQGSKHETDETSGYSHLAEHLVLSKENTCKPKYQNLVNKLYNNGAMINAGTNKEHTYYYTTGLNHTLSLSLEALSEMLTKSALIDEAVLEKEKNVVVQEAISFYSSFNQIKERSSQALYGKSGVGRTIVGNIDNVRSATLQDMTSLIERSYRPENATVVVVGDVEYDETLKMLGSYFGSWEDRLVNIDEQAIDSEAGIYLNENENASNAVISLCFRTPSFLSKERNALKLMTNMLGDASNNSRLVQRIRYDAGLAYTVGAFNNLYSNRGTLGMTVVCSNENIKSIMEIMSEEINSIRNVGFRQDELERAKMKLETSTRIELHDITSHLVYLGKVASYGRIFSLENEIRDINKISLEEIHSVYSSVFVDSEMGIAAIGNVNIDDVISNINIG